MKRLLVSMTVTRQVPLIPGAPTPIDGWGVEAPVDSRIVNVGTSTAGDLSILLLINPQAVRVWLPLLIIPVGSGYHPMLGRQIGECFGVCQLGGVFALFADTPWPTGIADAKPEGTA